MTKDLTDTAGNAARESDGTIRFTIPAAPRTKKNHSRVSIRYGKPVVIPSKAYQEFETKCRLLIPARYKIGIDYPVNVKATYYVDSARRVDITNLESALMDALVAAGVLKDDSAINPCIVASTDGSRLMLDRKHPRIEVEIKEVDYGC